MSRVRKAYKWEFDVKRNHQPPSPRRYEILGVLMLGATALLCLALLSDGFRGQGLDSRPLEGMTKTPNLLGPPGAILATLLAILIGDAAHILYAVTFVWGLMLVTHHPLDRFVSRALGLLVLTFATAGLLQLNLATGNSSPQPGGAMGAFVMDRVFGPPFGVVGAHVIGCTLLLIGTLLATDFLFVHALIITNRIMVHLIRGSLALFDAARASLHNFLEKRAARKAATTSAPKVQEKARAEKKQARQEEPEADKRNFLQRRWDKAKTKNHDLERIRIRPADETTLPPIEEDLPFEAPPAIEAEKAEAPPVEEELPFVEAMPEEDIPMVEAEVVAEPAPPVAAAPKKKPRPRRKNMEIDELPPDYQYPKNYTIPAISMLTPPEPKIILDLKDRLREMSLLLEDTLQTFNIDARVTDVTRGPTITRFELEPAPGIKVSRFLSLADDIALALKAQRVRVEAPIPGKGRVGIEVPNQERDPVVVRELLENRAFTKGKGQLKLALGKDIAGSVRIADLATMPHLLVAGATGAGKTVCVKALLGSLLFQHTPDEMQLMLIDPKMVELSIFNDIPHLITPVVTDPKKAATSLTWLITEMEERYRLFADLRVRNIEVYNDSVENGEIELEGGEDEETQSLHIVRKLPYIVCVIDELADLMMLARSEVEDAIARLAQLARAVGIHLIIATQRPSVDVLTGVIKANFPARISFQVSSRVDSRCILDEIGAERLIGMGDMLYLPAGQSKPDRIQGAFISDEEMNALIAYLKRQAPPQYRDEIANFGKGSDATTEAMDADDPLLDEAVQVVLETGQASISMVQRRLRVGYTRAARLVDMMEMKGIVGPHIGSKAREILVSTSPKDEVA
jgi:DNA segregation ATPase FtsK/SpoIIIE-like protein